MTDGVYGFQQPQSASADFPLWRFFLQRMLAQMQTASLVVVKACSNQGGVVPVGTVDVQIMVNQVSGDGTPEPHGVITGIPYHRIQGGANAIILDPQPGDIGVCLFASRDISNVVKTKKISNPGSQAMFDYSSGLYLGGWLNATPSQYFAFSAQGVQVVSPTRIDLSAPTIVLTASNSVVINSPANNIEGGGTTIDNKNFLGHFHTASGGSGNGGPVG